MCGICLVGRLAGPALVAAARGLAAWRACPFAGRRRPAPPAALGLHLRLRESGSATRTAAALGSSSRHLGAAANGSRPGSARPVQECAVFL